MTSEQTAAAAAIRNFTLSTDIFHQPGLDIYAQMAYIVLSSYASEANAPALSDIAGQSRMDMQQAIRAMQTLAEQKLIPHKLFRRMIGEFHDDRLSWTAKGLLAYCKQHEVRSLDELIAMSGRTEEDEASIRRALKELERYGYLDDLPDIGKLAN